MNFTHMVLAALAAMTQDVNNAKVKHAQSHINLKNNFPNQKMLCVNVAVAKALLLMERENLMA